MQRNKKLFALAVLLGLLLIGGMLWLGMWLGARNAEPRAERLAEARSVTGAPARPAALGGASAPQTLPPWLTAMPNGAASGQSASPANQAERQKQLAELKAMQLALQKSMQENQRVDPRQVDALLLKIKQVTGSSTVGGVNLDVLRANLARSEEMQRVAQEMNREAAKQGGGDPKRLKAYSDQLQELQRQHVAANALPAVSAGGAGQ